MYNVMHRQELIFRIFMQRMQINMFMEIVVRSPALASWLGKAVLTALFCVHRSSGRGSGSWEFWELQLLVSKFSSFTLIE